MINNHFEEYNTRKDELIVLLREAVNFYESLSETKICQSIKDNIEVIQSGEFEVVVVGEFSSGKSTFLNALMGEKFLPSYTKETTATINYLRNVSESEYPGIVYYVDGHTEILKNLDGNVIEQYVSTKSKEIDVSKTIKHLDLYLNSPFLENHVTLIDSPGLNGMKQGLSEITDAQIKKSHAVIFLFSAEQPGKRSDFEYLKKIKDEVNTVFLVLNKIDCIKKSENQTVEDTIENLIASYKAVFPEDKTFPEVIPIAAYPALVARSKRNLDYPANHFNVSQEEKILLEEKSLMKNFEKKLMHFLSNSEKTVMQIREPLLRLRSNLVHFAEYIKNEIDVIENERSGMELDKQILEIQKVIQSLESQIADQKGEVRKAIRIVERNVLEYLEMEIEHSVKKANANVEELSSIEVLDDYLEVLNQVVGREIRGLNEKLDERFREEFFDQVQEQYAHIIFQLEDQLESGGTGNFAFDVKINVSANTVNAGIENFNTMKKDIEHNISKLEESMRNAGKNEDKLIEDASRLEELRSKCERIRQSQAELQNTFCPPEVDVVTKTGRREVSRSGFLGKAADFIMGKKTEEYSYQERDDSARKEYLEEFKAEKQELADKEACLEEELEKYYGADKKLEKAEEKREQIQAELQRVREREMKFTREFNEKLNKKYEQEIKRIKNRIRTQIEEIFNEVRPLIKDTFRKNRAVYVAVLQDLLEQSIKSQLDLKEQEWEHLLQLRNDTMDNKEEILTERRKNAVIVQTLLERSEDLLKKVESIEIDKIEYRQI